MYIPIWLLITGAGVGIFYMGNKWAGVVVGVIGLVWGGILNIPFLAPVVQQIKSLV